MKNAGTSSPLVCDLAALEPRTRRLHEALTRKLFRTAESVSELPNGLGLRFSNERSVLLQVAAFISNEQRCCPFLTFYLRLEPGKERLELSLTGGRQVKRFLRMEFADMLRTQIS